MSITSTNSKTIPAHRVLHQVNQATHLPNQIQTIPAQVQAAAAAAARHLQAAHHLTPQTPQVHRAQALNLLTVAKNTTNQNHL